MAFIETRLLDRIRFGVRCGPMFNTEVIEVNSGARSANQVWTYPLHRADFSEILENADYKDELLAAFWACAGRAHGFRVKDWNDYAATVSTGLQGLGVGTGLPTYPLEKKYVFGAQTAYRLITKPVSGTVSLYRGGSPVTLGVSAGNAAIDTTTGIVTYVADASSNASSITPGATTQVVLAANPGTLIAGKKLYLSGFTGADAAEVNGLAHTINSVTGTGPYTFTLATNTSGKTITLGSGVGKAYPQASEALTAAFEFDIPMAFDSDYQPLAYIGRGKWDCDVTATEIRV